MKTTRQRERELVAQIAEKSKQYHDAVQKLPLRETVGLDTEIKTLKQQLSDLLSEGALPCPYEPKRVDDPNLTKEDNDAVWNTMKHVVLGMKKTDDPVKGIEVYEVGCLACAPRSIDVGDTLPRGGKSKVKGRLSMSSRAGSRDAVIENWNDGIFIIDANVF